MLYMYTIVTLFIFITACCIMLCKSKWTYLGVKECTDIIYYTSVYNFAFMLRI